MRKLQAYYSRYSQWSEWSPWSKCSVDCGEAGFSVRRRECLTLPTICPGNGFDMQTCSSGVSCQARFHEWGEWGPCSVTCGKGVRARSRVCVTGDRDMKCRGPSTMLEKCTEPKCGPVPPPVTSAPALSNIPIVGSPAVAYILSPGIAVGANAYPIAQPAYGSPGGVYAVPQTGASQQQHPPGYMAAGGAGGFGAVAAASVQQSKGAVSKITVVETGDGSGPLVVAHHESGVEASPEEQMITPETILFIVLFLLCLLLLIISFSIYCYQRINESETQKKLKEARPLYKQDSGEDDDLDKPFAQGHVKPIIRPGPGIHQEQNMPPPLVYPASMVPEQIIFAGSGEPSGQLEEVPTDNMPSDQMMLAGQQVQLDEMSEPEEGKELGDEKGKSVAGKELGEKRKSAQGKELSEKRKSAQGKELGEKRKSAEGKELSGKRKSAEGKELGEKRKSAEGKELSEKIKSAEGKELDEKRKSAEGKEVSGKKKSKKKGESDQSLVAGEKEESSKQSKKTKSKKEKKTKSKLRSPSPSSQKSNVSSTSASDQGGNALESSPQANKSASNVASYFTEREAVDLRLPTQKRKYTTLLKDHSAGDSLSQDDGLPQKSKLELVPNRKEQVLPTLHSTEIPIVEEKRTWSAAPSDHTQYLDNLSSKQKVVLNYSLLLPSCEHVTSVGDAHVACSTQETCRSRAWERLLLGTEGTRKSYEIKRWNRKVRKFQSRKRTDKRAKRKLKTYLKSVFRQKCHMSCQRHKHCRFGLALEKHIAGIDMRVLNTNGRALASSESDTTPKDESTISANSSFYINKFSLPKAVNRAEEVQRLVDTAQTNKSCLRQGGKLDAEMKILRGSLGNRRQTLSSHHGSRSSLHYKFPALVYRHRRGRFSSSSSSWLSTLLSESDRKLNEIERDMDAVLKEQRRLCDRNTILSPLKAASSETLQPFVNDVKDGDIFTGEEKPGSKSVKICSESQELSAEDISHEGESASKSQVKCLKQSESSKLTVAMIDEEPLKCDRGDSVHEYEKKKEDILKLLHSSSPYQSRGQSVYYAHIWPPQTSARDRGYYLLNSHPRSQGEHIQANEGLFLMQGEPAASLTSQATSAVWTDQDSKGDFKTTSDTSNVHSSSANQQTLTDSIENNMQTASVSFPLTSKNLLSDMWQTERNKLLNGTDDVSRSIANDNCNPNDDTWRNIQRTLSEKSEASVRIVNKELAEVHKKADLHGRFHFYMQFRECPEMAQGFSARSDGQQTKQGQNIREPADSQSFLPTPVKEQHCLERHAVPTTSRGPVFLNKNDGSRKQMDDKINSRCPNQGAELTSVAPRPLAQGPAPASSHVDIPGSSYAPDSISVPTSVLDSYQENAFQQTNEKCSCEESGPVATRLGQAGYEMILDKQLEQFVDSTSSNSAKDRSKSHIEWNINKDSKRKMYNMFQRSMLSQDTNQFGASSTSSAVTSTRGQGSGQYVLKISDQATSAESMFCKQNAYQEELQEHQQYDRCNTASSEQKHTRGMHEDTFGRVFSQNSYYQSCPEVSRASGKAASTSGEEVTVADDSKWHSACSDAAVSTHHYISCYAPNTLVRKRGQTDTCDSRASIYDNFYTPELEMSWETSKTNGSTWKSTYESPCKADSAFYAQNRTYNSSIPCSLNRTFLLDSASSCNNSADCDTSINVPYLSEHQSWRTHARIPGSQTISTNDVCIFKEVIPPCDYFSDDPVISDNFTSSRHMSTEDVCIFKEMYASSSCDNCSDYLIMSDKESPSFADSIASRANAAESSWFDLRKPDLCHKNLCSSSIDNQSECLASNKQQIMPRQTCVSDSCNDSVGKENSSNDAFSVSVHFSKGSKLTETSHNKEQEEKHVCCNKDREEKHICWPYHNHLDRLDMGLACNTAFYQELVSGDFGAAPASPWRRPVQELPVSGSSIELPSQRASKAFQALPWLAGSLTVDNFSGKSDVDVAASCVQPPGDLSSWVNNSDNFDEWETKIDYMSFVNEADSADSRHSSKVILDTTYNIVSPETESSWTGETSLSCPCDLSVSGDKIHMSKYVETLTATAHASDEISQLDKRHSSEGIESISCDLVADFLPRTGIVSNQGCRDSTGKNADSFQKAAADRWFVSSNEGKSEKDASSTKHSEMKYKEHFVQEGKRAERHASVQAQQKHIDNWNSSAEGRNIMQVPGAESDCQGFVCEGKKQHDSFTARLELATVFYKRAIQWSPLFDGWSNNRACDVTTSICSNQAINSPAVLRHAQTASNSSVRLEESHKMQPKKSCHRTTRRLTPVAHTAQTAVHSSSVCGHSHGLRNVTTNKLEKYGPAYTMLIVKRDEYLGCGDRPTAAEGTCDHVVQCSEKVHLKSTLQAACVLSGAALGSSPTPKGSLLMESIPKAEPVSIPKAEPVSIPRAEPVSIPRAEPVSILRAEPVSIPRAEPVSIPRAVPMSMANTGAQHSVERSNEEITSLNGNSGVAHSSPYCRSSEEQESMAQDSCSVAAKNHVLCIDMTRNMTTPDSLKDELHNLDKCNEWTETQRNTFNLASDLHLAATVHDICETDAVPENMVCHGGSSLSSGHAAENRSPSASYEHETCSSSVFSEGKLCVGSHEHLLCSGVESATDSATCGSGGEFSWSCPQRASCCSTNSLEGECCQRQVNWKPKDKQDVMNTTECEHCHTTCRKTFLCSSPESVHSSIFDVSCQIYDSSDERNVDYTHKHISVSNCASCESNVHFKELDSFSSSSYEKQTYSQASHSYIPADSSDKRSVYSHREDTLGIHSSPRETYCFEPEKHDSHSCSSSSKSNVHFAEKFSSNLHSWSDERHISSASSAQDYSCVYNFNIPDESVMNENSSDSEIAHDASWTRSFWMFDEPECSQCPSPSDVPAVDDCQSSMYMPQRSSTFLDVLSVDNNVQSHAGPKHYPQTGAFCTQELCRRQSFNHPQSEDDCLDGYSEVINQSFDTDEPEFMPANSKHYQEIAAFCMPELCRRHTSHNPELDNLWLDECSEVTNQSFNRDEPELLQYNCGSQPDVSTVSSSHLLVENNEFVETTVRDSVCRH